MKRTLPIAACCVLLTSVFLHAGEVFDRIVATVNGHIITQSDWDEAIRYEALTGGKTIQTPSQSDYQAVLNRLIDQELLHEQMRPTDPQYGVEDDVVVSHLKDVRKLYQGADSDAAWHDVLAKYDFSEEEVKIHLARQLDILRLIDDHLRGSVAVEDEEVETYYKQTFLPQLQQTGAKQVPLAEVDLKIRELLLQQKLNQALAEWIQSLRDSSVIRTDVLPPVEKKQAN
jgi:peptidyl-prolyl cis-trans isomerase SurA